MENILFIIKIVEIICFIAPICIIIFAIITTIQNKKQINETFNVIKNNEKISEFSFQKYAKFYGDTVLFDNEFNYKINKIYDLIINKKYTNIEEIANESHCTIDECILKIKYLKNKRIIGDYYINHITKEIKKCSKEDKALLNKYVPYIYGQHFQIDEIATHLPGTTIKTKKKVEDQIYKDLKYLYDKDLINGLIINDVDRTIKYYSVEKKLKAKDYVTMQCEHCGALNDVRRGNKTRCEYCNSIIENKEKVI